MEPGLAWATKETVDYLTAAISAVHKRHSGSHVLSIGHISANKGGYLSPHKSHQSGRDVDTSYYYKADQPFRWYRPANADNLDRARTWTFVRALLTDTDVEWIFINTSVQKLLKEYALSIGEDREWLDSVFQYGSRHPWPLIRHAHGHDTHIHVRFYNPVAQELGRRSYGALVAAGRIQAPIYYQRHRAQKGEILSRIARRYGVTIKDIQKANKLRSTLIRAGQEYLIPRTGQVAPAAKLVVPPRRLPPEGSARAARRVAGPQDG
jgi:penicillin-insensitive murein endopeptidase